MSFVAKHCIENEEQLAHARGKGRLGMLAPGAQPQIEGFDGRIAADIAATVAMYRTRLTSARPLRIQRVPCRLPL